MQKKDQVIFWNYPLNFCFKTEPERPKMPIRSREHLGPGRRKLHVGSALMSQQPAQCNRVLQSGAVLVRRSASFEVSAVYPLDENSSVLHLIGPLTNGHVRRSRLVGLPAGSR